VTGLNSHQAADREALQRAARILLRDGYPFAAEALNRTIEAHYPKPPSFGEIVYSHTACTWDRCPCPGTCKPIGCIQHPHAEQQELAPFFSDAPEVPTHA
jgi:hypothetical protein